MESIIISIVNKFGYLGIVLLIAIENIFPPIPSEVILTFGGFATTISDITVMGTIIAATIGSVIGAIILYYIGKFLNEDRIDAIIKSNLGKILGLKSCDTHKAFNWFENKGNFAVFFGRFIPIVRSLISIPAGMSEMPLGMFLILTTVGSLIWNTVLIMLGRFAGNSWGKIAGCVGGYSDIILIAFIAVFVFGIIKSYSKKNKKVKIIWFKTNQKRIKY